MVNSPKQKNNGSWTKSCITHYKECTIIRKKPRIQSSRAHFSAIRLMDEILHDPKDPKLWELWVIFLIMGHAGFCPSTEWPALCGPEENFGFSAIREDKVVLSPFTTIECGPWLKNKFFKGLGYLVALLQPLHTGGSMSISRWSKLTQTPGRNSPTSSSA